MTKLIISLLYDKVVIPLILILIPYLPKRNFVVKYHFFEVKFVLLVAFLAVFSKNM